MNCCEFDFGAYFLMTFFFLVANYFTLNGRILPLVTAAFRNGNDIRRGKDLRACIIDVMVCRNNRLSCCPVQALRNERILCAFLQQYNCELYRRLE